MRHNRARLVAVITLAVAVSTMLAGTIEYCTCPGAGSVLNQSKISSMAGKFRGPLHNGDTFGAAVTWPGDLNDDGIADVAVGAYNDDDGGMSRGAVWVIFLNANGTVSGQHKISSASDDLPPTSLDDGDSFGLSIVSLGDFNNDGIADLAVGAPGDDDGGMDRGAVWLLFLNANGTVKDPQKISDIAGLLNSDYFGSSLASPGDIDGDGITDLAVGAIGDDDGGTERGAVWVLFLNADGTVKGQHKISGASGDLPPGALDDNDWFGYGVGSVGDLDREGIPDLAVGAYKDDDGGMDRGAVWVLFLNADGTVESHQKISDTAGGFTGELKNGDRFGNSVASLGDLDGDGVADLAVGAYTTDDGGTDRGAVWVLFLSTNGTVEAHQKISDIAGGFPGELDNFDYFGASVGSPGDLDGDGVVDLAVGAYEDDDGGTNRGAVWILTLDGCVPTVPPLGDLNRDCAVNGADLGIMLGAWGGCAECDDCPADLNGDCVVNGADLGMLLGGWG